MAERQARLADAADAEQRDQSGRTLEHLLERLQCVFSPDEGIALCRQVIRNFADRRPLIGHSDHAVSLDRVGWWLEQTVVVLADPNNSIGSAIPLTRQ
jgi:hypothetical protein